MSYNLIMTVRTGEAAEPEATPALVPAE